MSLFWILISYHMYDLQRFSPTLRFSVDSVFQFLPCMQLLVSCNLICPFFHLCCLCLRDCIFRTMVQPSVLVHCPPCFLPLDLGHLYSPIVGRIVKELRAAVSGFEVVETQRKCKTIHSTNTQENPQHETT